MNFHVLTLFPDMIMQGLSESIMGKALEKGCISVEAVNIRDYTEDKHKKVDDYPYGGGAGLLMQAQPVCDAHEAVLHKIGKKKVRTIYLTPQGRTFTQRMAEELAREEDLIFLCGHYEGIDERALEEVVTDYVSLGDFVLTGGELPAMVMIDAIARLVPGVLHNDDSAADESFSGYLLEYPQYSRPEVFKGKKVPDVLLSGDHKKIRAWREEAAIERTRIRRPDMYAAYERLTKCRNKLLKKDKLRLIAMSELIHRAQATLLYDGEDGVLLKERNRELYMFTAPDKEAGKRILEHVFGKPSDADGKDCIGQEAMFVTHDRFLNDILIADYGFKEAHECIPYVYTRKETLPVRNAEIRQLDASFLEEVCLYYRLTGKEYVRDCLLSGNMFGIFVEGKLAGFMGEHTEGSLGMLEILPAYRRKGLASVLESYMINRSLQKGNIPYGQVFPDNEASLKLQEKLGLYPAKNPIWWVGK